MRKALIVGIDYYSDGSRLHGCVNDSFEVKSVLDRNADGSPNFNILHLKSSSAEDLITRQDLRRHIQELFRGNGDIALLYFAGHGHIEATGGYLCASDSVAGNDGISLSDIMTMANQSSYNNRIIILDSCHSGIAGAAPLNPGVSEISEGVTILTASSADQYSLEEDGSGVFTSLLVDALSGGAANLIGHITPGSVYAHIDQSLGPWAQRPVFKTNVDRFASLKRVQSPIDLSDLQRIGEFFPERGFLYQLDPSYEPERAEDWVEGESDIPAPDPDKNSIFKVLQAFNRIGLLVPVDAPHMWHAAMGYKSVKLTALGEHYRKLVLKGLI